MKKIIFSLILILIPLIGLASTPNLFLGTTVLIKAGVIASPTPSPSPTSTSSGGYPSTISQTHVVTIIQDLCNSGSGGCYHGDTSSVPLSTLANWITGAEVDATSYVSAVKSAGILVKTYGDPDTSGSNHGVTFPVGDELKDCSGNVLTVYGGRPLLNQSSSTYQTDWANAYNPYFATNGYQFAFYDNGNAWLSRDGGTPCPSDTQLQNGVITIIQNSTVPVQYNTGSLIGTRKAPAEAISKAEFDNASNLQYVVSENCYSGEAAGEARRIVGTEWQESEDTELYTPISNRSFQCNSENTTNDGSTLGDRTYAYASFLISFNPQYSAWGSYWCLNSSDHSSGGPYNDCNYTSTGDSIQIMPEVGFVPLYPLVAAPTSNITTSSVNTFEEGSTGVYYREYAACYYRGNLIGHCAAVVNISSSTQNLPTFSQSYNHTMTIAGYGEFAPSPDTGNVSFTGSYAGGTIAATTGKILIQ